MELIKEGSLTGLGRGFFRHLFGQPVFEIFVDDPERTAAHIQDKFVEVFEDKFFAQGFFRPLSEKQDLQVADVIVQIIGRFFHHGVVKFLNGFLILDAEILMDEARRVFQRPSVVIDADIGRRVETEGSGRVKGHDLSQLGIDAVVLFMAYLSFFYMPQLSVLMILFGFPLIAFINSYIFNGIFKRYMPEATRQDGEELKPILEDVRLTPQPASSKEKED